MRGTDQAWYPQPHADSGRVRHAVRFSHYVTMRDGVRIAIDVHLPQRRPLARSLPTMLHQTRYFRRLQLRGPLRLPSIRELLDGNAPMRNRFLRAGYAWIDVCVRGSGASFGRRLCAWSDDEVRDGREIVDWIIRQPWSNGKVGAMGVSYDGTAAEMLLSDPHPAICAVAPLFSVFDIYPDVAFPGGVHLTWFTELWGEFNRALDENALPEAFALTLGLNLDGWRQSEDSTSWRRSSLDVLRSASGAQFIGWAARRLFGGVGPVDYDMRNELLRDAVAEHADNYDVHMGACRITYRDDTNISNVQPSMIVDDFSPHRCIDTIRRSGVPVYSYSGWLDGGYNRAAIKRHLSLDAPGCRLTLGPWNHVGRQNISPFSSTRKPAFQHDIELLRFFDLHVRGRDTGLSDEPPVHFFTMGAERWQEAETWPPPGLEMVSCFFGPDGCLGREPAPSGDTSDVYVVDESHGTGTCSRWRSLLGVKAPIGYPDRSQQGRGLLWYTSSTLPADLEVTGHPIVRLYVSCSERDGAFFAYLEDVDPTGRATYVTEGQLRALHRQTAEPRHPYDHLIPPRSYERNAAKELREEEVSELVFDLLPISYLFRAGHALRVSLAGGDCDHFAPVLPRAPVFRIYRTAKYPSRIELPVAGRP